MSQFPYTCAGTCNGKSDQGNREFDEATITLDVSMFNKYGYAGTCPGQLSDDKKFTTLDATYSGSGYFESQSDAYDGVAFIPIEFDKYVSRWCSQGKVSIKRIVSVCSVVCASCVYLSRLDRVPAAVRS